MRHITLKHGYRLLNPEYRRHVRRYICLLLKHQDGQTATERTVKNTHLSLRHA